jgi:hypothetical protein
MALQFVGIVVFCRSLAGADDAKDCAVVDGTVVHCNNSAAIRYQPTTAADSCSDHRIPHRNGFEGAQLRGNINAFAVDINADGLTQGATGTILTSVGATIGVGNIRR